MTVTGRHLSAMLLLFLLPLLACSSLDVTYSGKPEPGGAIPRSEDYSRRGRQKYAKYYGVVAVYRSKAEIKGRHYENLGKITVRSRYEYPEEQSELVLELQRQAAERGANAILLLDQDDGKDSKLNRLRASALRMQDGNIRHW
jgi:hypothetical protein